MAISVLQLLQMRQQQLSEIDARDEEAAAAHDCDFASLKSIVVPALADGEQLQRLWRSIDVTGNGSQARWSRHLLTFER
jgi:hypothetical protein